MVTDSLKSQYYFLPLQGREGTQSKHTSEKVQAFKNRQRKKHFNLSLHKKYLQSESDQAEGKQRPLTP